NGIPSRRVDVARGATINGGGRLVTRAADGRRMTSGTRTLQTNSPPHISKPHRLAKVALTALLTDFTGDPILGLVNTYQEAQLGALGDAPRRAILAGLLDGPLAVGELARHFPVSRPAISQHLRILKDANLVTDRAQGTRRLYALNPEGFDTL